MSEHQTRERSDSLRSAMARMSEARDLRDGPMPTLVHPYQLGDEGDVGPAQRRRSFFRFGERARRAVHRDS